MSNYTKTTDFEAKDSLPTGDSGKIIRGAEFETEFDAISTAIATKADTAGPTFTGTLTFETISDGTIGVTAFVDEDDMSSDSATLVPTQQSVKAYVDAVTTELQAQDLDFQADSGGALSIDLDTETMTFTGGTGITTTGLANDVTFAIDSTVTTLTGTQTLTNKTLTSPDVNTPDIDGGTIDGTVIGGTTPAAVSATTVSATGNITVGGTVDGRDVATDGTKLDGIESGATADQTAAEIRTLVESATDSNVFTDADHTKLDGIEAGATGDQTNAEIRAAVEAATDSNVFTDADHSKLDGIEALADVTDTTNVTAAGALMDSELTNITAVKALNQGVATTDTPTFAGLTTTADVSFGDNDKAIFGAGSDLQLYHDGSTSFIDDVGDGNLHIRTDGASIKLRTSANADMIVAENGGAAKLYHAGSQKLATLSTGIDVTGVITTDGMTTSADVNFGDDDKAVFGAGSDLEIYHESSTGRSFIKETGADEFRILGSNIRIKNGGDSKTYMQMTDGGSVAIRHNDATKLETTSSGIDVTGGIAATDDSTFTAASGDIYVTASTPTGAARSGFRVDETANNGFEIAHDNADNAFFISRRSGSSTVVDALKIDRSTGDFSLFENTGTTPKLFWDASAERLGIGNSSPATALDVTGTVTADGLTVGNSNIGSNTSHLANMTINNNGYIGSAADTTAIQITTAGNVNFTGGDISFYEDTGTTAKFAWDAADETISIGLGASSTATISAFSRTVSANLPSALRIIENTGASTYWDIGANNGANPNLNFYVNANTTPKMTLASSGNVGIGTSSSIDQKLTLVDTADVGIKMLKTGSGTGTIRTVGGGMAFGFDGGSGTTERMRIDSSGNVLVGKTSSDLTTDGFEVRPTGFVGVRTNGDPLYLNRKSTDGAIATFAKDGTTVGSINTNAGAFVVKGASTSAPVQLQTHDGNEDIEVDPDGFIKMETAGSERLRIDASGNVGIGTTSPSFISGSGLEIQRAGIATLRLEDTGSSGKAFELSIDDSTGAVLNSASSGLPMIFKVINSERMRIDTSGNLLVGTTTGNGTNADGFNLYEGSGGSRLYIGHANGTANGTQYVVFNYNSGQIGSISQSGTTAVLYNTTSDQRLKDNIVDAPSASDDIDAIQVRSFDWKVDGSHQKYGMVAQELQSVAPEAVSQGETEEDMMGVDYSKLVPMMMKEIQSLRARVAQLEGEN